MILISYLLKKNKNHLPGVLVGVAFFFVGLLINQDFGMTVDEPLIRGAGNRYLAIAHAYLTGADVPSWPFHELRGYYFMMDAGRVLLSRGLAAVFPLRLLDAFHLTNLLFSTMAVFVMYGFAYRMSKSTVAAFVATLTLALSPNFIAHSQNNPMDMTTLSVFSLALYCLYEATHSASMKAFWISSFTLGLALVSRPMCALILVIFFMWLLWDEKEEWRRFVPRLALIVFVSSAWAYLMWPWLWPDPFIRLLESLNHLLEFEFNIQEVYWGKIIRVSDLPWYYTAVNFFVSTPLFFVGLACLSVVYFLRDPRLNVGVRRVFRLGFLWLFIGLVASINSTLAYNAWRHFLFILPGFCLLVGAGAAWLWSRVPRPVSIGVLSVGFVFVGVQMVRYHPYEGAYLNGAVTPFVGESAENYFSVEYFGQPYKEGALWLNRHAERNARVMVGVFPFIPGGVLNRKISRTSLPKFLDTTTPCYFMTITRPSHNQRPLFAYVEKNLIPVFTIRRGKGTLLKIYRNDAGKTSSAKAPSGAN